RRGRAFCGRWFCRLWRGGTRDLRHDLLRLSLEDVRIEAGNVDELLRRRAHVRLDVGDACRAETIGCLRADALDVLEWRRGGWRRVVATRRSRRRCAEDD